MARKPVPRRLPELKSLVPNFHGFTRRENQSTAVLEHLEKIIRRTRRREAVAFYSMREIAGFFGVSLRVIVRAYEKLEKDGLLTRLRGSHTLVEGRRQRSHHSARGVVGLPVELHQFVYRSDLRHFYIRLDQELRRHGYLVNFFFVHQFAITDSDLVGRLLSHQSDFVFIWMPPDKLLPTMHQLRDLGVRLFGMGLEQDRLPFPMYVCGWERAMSPAFASWQREGIDTFVVMNPSWKYPSHESPPVARVLQQLGVRHSTLQVNDADLPRHVERLVRRRNVGVVLGYHAWYDSLCNQFPRAMERLFCRSRVMLLQGPVFHQSFQGRKIPADVLLMDYEKMAGLIAREINTGVVWKQGPRATFHGQWEERMNLGAFSRDF